MNSLVSVIIPVYNVERYLRQCIDSVLTQTYTNLEIILVDDGSPDASPTICDEYAQKDKRIKVIHKENGGLSSARNAGLDICKGEYISFVDSDDQISSDFVLTLLTLLEKTSSEIAICNFSSNLQEMRLSVQNNLYETLSPIETIKQLWSENGVAFVSACGKIYVRNLWKNFRFPKGKIHEDEFTTYIILFSAQKIVFNNNPLYFYNTENTNSITHTEANRLFNSLKAYEERYYFFKKNNVADIVKLCAMNLYWPMLQAYIHYNQIHIENDYPQKKRLLNIAKEAFFDCTQFNIFSKRDYIKLMIILNFPTLYGRLKKYFNK